MWVGRQYALGRGRWRAQLTVYVFIALQFYNVVLLGAYQPEARLGDEEAVTIKSEFAREAYKTATQEIHHRLEQEQHFYILKFTMIGSLLAVFFRFLLSTDEEKQESKPTSEDASPEATPTEKKRASLWRISGKDAIDKLRGSKIAAFFFWAAVIINCIVDTRLRYNAVICTALGRWIRTLEASIEEHGMPGWETFFDQQALISSSPLMQIAPTLLTTIVFVLTVVLFIAKEQVNVTLRGNVHDKLHQVNLVFGGIAFVVMAFSALGQPGMVWEWAGPVLAWVATGIVVLILGPKTLQGRVFRRDEITDSLVGYAFPFHYFNLHNTPHIVSRFWPGNRTADKHGGIVRGTWRLLQFVLAYPWAFVALVRVAGYFPAPRIRRALVRWVNYTLSLEFIHLEVSRDPQWNEIPRVTSDEGPPENPSTMVWSLLYLKAGPKGIERLREAAKTSLAEKTGSALFACCWWESHTKLIRRRQDGEGSNSDKFEVRNPEQLVAWTESAVMRARHAEYVPCAEVRYCRVHDHYDEHNPWLLLVCELAGKANQPTEVIVVSAKDLDSHSSEVAGRWV
jgi:hypothetical protein